MPKIPMWKGCVRLAKLWFNRSKTRSWPGDDGRTTTRLIWIGVILVVQVWIENYNMTTIGKMYGALMHYDRPMLIRLFRNAVLTATVNSLVWPFSLYVQWETGFDCAIQVENNLVDRYMANDNFYKISQIDGRIKDPEQRICEDIFAAVFGFWSTILFGTALPICKLFFFTYRVGAIMGHKWSLGIAGILAMNMAVIKYAMPDYGKMYKDLSNQEGKFKKIQWVPPPFNLAAATT
jgi:ABC-type uncharacterized transport system fused permease/ATPase subunit